MASTSASFGSAATGNLLDIVEFDDNIAVKIDYSIMPFSIQ